MLQYPRFSPAHRTVLSATRAQLEQGVVQGRAVTDTRRFVQGIGEAFGVAAFCHLGEIMEALRDFSRLLESRKSVPGEASEEERDSAEREMHATSLLCCGQAASGAKPDDLLQMAEHIVAEVLFHFRAQSKDEEMKRIFMRAIVMIARAIVRTRREDAEFPRKSETVVCISGIIEEEPLGSLSINHLHQALVTISSMTCLKPPLESEVSSELVSKAIQKVLSLPFFRVARGNAGSPTFQTQVTWPSPGGSA
ncbi:uncharacterized protein LOC123020216 [Varanus komodoensis]|uniref:uncharacterized protein LOC123020216 n=1 Tax=Varanus komodoensis TaxID=61221 RepID=UPI001CF7E7D2|nr:uncharacterized protein LOC123020216 [Varanus komodoensis]